MKYILGIDAAWTLNHPSGVALVALNDNGVIEFIKGARSYHEFYDDKIRWEENVYGSKPDFAQLSDYCENNGWPLGVISLDIPLSPNPITGRRGADREISRVFGGRGASTHSPNAERPGPVSEDLFEQLNITGFRWNGDGLNERSFIEIYPHTAIIELFDYSYRLPYKVEKRGKYWPDCTTEEKLVNIICNLNELKLKLAELIPNLNAMLPSLHPECMYSTRFLKGYEDLLDSLVCAVTGCFYIQGKVTGYGDASSKIWVPYTSE